MNSSQILFIERQLDQPHTKRLIDKILTLEESDVFDVKRVSGKMVQKALQTVCAFSNTRGGVLALGLEDPNKARGKTRLYGVDENPEAIDELLQAIRTRLVPGLDEIFLYTLPTRLRNRKEGTVLLLDVSQSADVHSILDGGTWKRLKKSNRQMTAQEINDLSYRRGKISADSESVDVDLSILETEFWDTYCRTRGVRSGSADERMVRLGLAKSENGKVQPTRTAVLLFADFPSDVLATVGSRAGIRVFQYAGTSIKLVDCSNRRIP